MDKRIIYQLLEDQLLDITRTIVTVCGEGDTNKAFRVMTEMGLYKSFNDICEVATTVGKLRKANE